jgi:uncharacterized protein DUF3467
MADEQATKLVNTVGAKRRVRINTDNMKSAYCNFFNARANPEELVLNFGFDELSGSASKDLHQVQILQQVILSVATARGVRDALVTLLRRRDAAAQVHVNAQVVPPGKSN